MDTSRLLFLVFVLITTFECSETDESQCEDVNKESFNLLEGEAFYFVPSALPHDNYPDEEFTWYKNSSKTEYIFTDGKENVHYHGGALYFLNIVPENSGFYVGRQTTPSGKCANHHLKVNVFKARNDTALLYRGIEFSYLKKNVPCPKSVSYTCKVMDGKITWYKDFSLLQGEHEVKLWVLNTTKDDEGIYTCICTWAHGQKVYNSSGSRGVTVKETDESQCEDANRESFNLLEGEAFYFVPSSLPNGNYPDEEFIWYKNNSKIEYISTEHKENVHYHGGALYFFNIVPENSGSYTGRQTNPQGECYSYHLKVNVFKEINNEALLYSGIENSDLKKKVPCPEPVRKTCNFMNGKITWYKDFNLLQGEHEYNLWFFNTKVDESTYTCICTWAHNHKVYNSSASMRLTVKEQPAYHPLVIISPSSTDKEQFADEGFGIQLNCSVICGTNLKGHCRASWHVPFNQTDGYNQTTKLVTDKHSQRTISTATLTIEKVSAKDFRAEFKCIGEGFNQVVSVTLTLKRRESIIPLVIRGVCVLFLFVFTAVLIKCFPIDLALSFFPQSSHNNGGAPPFPDSEENECDSDPAVGHQVVRIHTPAP